MRFLILCLLISSCASTPSKYVIGCVHGTMMTFMSLTEQDWHDSFTYKTFAACEDLEKQNENNKRRF